MIIFLQRSQELPCLDDVSGVDDRSQALAALTIALVILVLIPYPATPVPVGQSSFFGL